MFNRYLVVFNKPLVRLKIMKYQLNHPIHVILAFHFIKTTCYNPLGYVVHLPDKNKSLVNQWNVINYPFPLYFGFKDECISYFRSSFSKIIPLELALWTLTMLGIPRRVYKNKVHTCALSSIGQRMYTYSNLWQHSEINT